MLQPQEGAAKGLNKLLCVQHGAQRLARSTTGSPHVTRNRRAGGPGSAATAPPPGSRLCVTGPRRGVWVSRPDLWVTGGKERQTSGEAMRSPRRTHGGKQSIGIAAQVRYSEWALHLVFNVSFSSKFEHSLGCCPDPGVGRQAQKARGTLATPCLEEARPRAVALQPLVARKWNLYMKIRRGAAPGTSVMALTELIASLKALLES